MASSKLTRTNGTATNGQKMTFSTWFKIGTQSSQQSLLSSVTGSGAATDLKIMASATHNNVFRFECITVEGSTIDLKLNRSLRDPSAWMHLVIAVDTTQVTSSNRVKIYINGVQETSFATATYPTQNHTLDFSKTGITQQVGAYSNSNYWNGSMSHIHFIDGLQYQASDFGETDATSGIWKAKTSPSVTYGTNGFFLKFENSGAMGTDSSGNGNTFTVSGTLTQNVDTPDNNFATLNPLLYQNGTKVAAPTKGNTTFTSNGGAAWGTLLTTIGASSGKYYCEAKCTTLGTYAILGICDMSVEQQNSNSAWYLGQTASSAQFGYHNSSGQIYTNDTVASYGNSFTTGDIIGIAMDLDNSKLYFSKNGVFQNSGVPTSGSTGTGAVSITADKTYGFGFSGYDATVFDCNFGNGYFGTTAVASANADGNGIGKMEYAVPTGYYTLNTKNIKEFG